MLNLSDKDLDRLSREAASEHDPGDVVGPESWDKLEIHLDRHLGHVIPHAVRGFYRLPFYYAPVVLLILGASYYFIRNHRAQKEASSGSPPLASVKPGSASTDKPSTSSQNPTKTDKATSTLVLPLANAEQPTAPLAGGTSPHDLTSGRAGPPRIHFSTAVQPSHGPGASRIDRDPFHPSHNAPASSIGHSVARPLLERSLSGKGRDRSIISPPGSSDPIAGISASSTNSAGSTMGPDNAPHQLSLSAVRGPVPTKRPGSVSDSTLRAFTAKAIPTPIRKKGGLYVNRSMQIGVLVAPDFSSVNSMSGDRPGSTIGLTADYQFAHRWYVGSGLLVSRKNYAAAPQDFHAPKDYYSRNLMTDDINYVKGSFDMLEVPLNLRYDFSVTGNTLFFASAGLSSYLLTRENCNYYYQPYQPFFNRQDIKGIHYDNHPDYLLSALNLSVGVEMGVSNSLSVIVAPYVKVPVRNIGFGQVELSSVGINFLLEFTPVLSRRR